MRQLGASALVVTHLPAVRTGSLLRFLGHCLGDPFLEALEGFSSSFWKILEGCSWASWKHLRASVQLPGNN